MHIPEAVFNTLKRNEEIARKFHEIEVGLLTILNVKDLCLKLLSEISVQFDIPLVWLTIIEDSPLAAFIDKLKDESLYGKVTFTDKMFFDDCLKGMTRPLLVNNGLEHFTPLFLKNMPLSPGSIAIAPIYLDGRIIGSLNQGDVNPYRFEPGIDTTLLERLAVKLSLCISNVTAHERLRYLAFHDPLTGLLNRGVMGKVLNREVERARRYGTDLSVIFIDLDNFKSINDRYGHNQGDLALVHVAEALSRLKRDSDIVARFAGDEFVIILPSTDREKSLHFLRRVEKELKNNPLPMKETSLEISLSYGTASFLEMKTDQVSEPTPEALLKQADEKLYQLKMEKKSPASAHRPKAGLNKRGIQHNTQ